MQRRKPETTKLEYELDPAKEPALRPVKSEHSGRFDKSQSCLSCFAGIFSSKGRGLKCVVRRSTFGWADPYTTGQKLFTKVEPGQEISTEKNVSRQCPEECGNCHSRDVLVVFAQYSNVDANLGEYADLEVKCHKCHRYTGWSYSD